MHSTKILLPLAALVGTAFSQKSDSEYCSAFFTSLLNIIISEAPKTPTDILSFLAARTTSISATTTTTSDPLTTVDFASHARELCSIATVLPESLLPEFQTYADALLSFGHHRSAEHIGYATDCAPEDEAASSTSYLEHIFTATANFCDETPAPGGHGTGGAAHPTSTSSYSNGSTTLIVTAAAARPTGAYLGAVAVGGVMGAAAML